MKQPKSFSHPLLERMQVTTADRDVLYQIFIEECFEQIHRHPDGEWLYEDPGGHLTPECEVPQVFTYWLDSLNEGDVRKYLGTLH